MEKVIFLDIDGVLQPLWFQNRFQHDLEALKKTFIEERGVEFSIVDKYDLGAVNFDWYEESVSYLKKLCEICGADIVLSSMWREGRTLKEMQLLFSLHNLDVYLKDFTEYLDGKRDLEIQTYLGKHPEIKYFVIFDDVLSYGLGEAFPENFIHCKGFLNEENFKKAGKILSCEGKL
ncbi:MAG: hypothetical protein H7A25_04005 [Leptospiraceae bacterium]|nr:hypothetical protein [Leptospiraceae bacterium]MCP5499039.1 hypothetical protein [Leptospiraceae bacterium]